MSGKKFIYINKSFLIKDKIGKKKLNQSILFILNKSSLKKSFMKRRMQEYEELKKELNDK